MATAPHPPMWGMPPNSSPTQASHPAFQQTQHLIKAVFNPGDRSPPGRNNRIKVDSPTSQASPNPLNTNTHNTANPCTNPSATQIFLPTTTATGMTICAEGPQTRFNILNYPQSNTKNIDLYQTPKHLFALHNATPQLPPTSQ
jgi:hypothetical protein